MDQKAESEIIIRVLNGDTQAYAKLVEAYKNPMYNLAYRMTHNDQEAEDLAQEIFLRAFEALSRFDINRRFFTWLYTIGLNVVRNHLKKAGSRVNGLDGEMVRRAVMNGKGEVVASSEEEESSDAMEKKLDRGLSLLSAKYREMLVLRYYEKLSFEEMSEITGYSLSAVKIHIYRGLDKLKKIMKTL